MQWVRRVVRDVVRRVLVVVSPCLPTLAHAQDVPPPVAAPPSFPPPEWIAPAPATWRELERDPLPAEDTHARWARLVDFTAENPDAELQVHDPGAREWKTVCHGPCKRWIWTPATYRVSGSGVRNSAKFGIYLESHPFVLRAETGSTGQLAGGIVLTSGGGVAILVGLVIFAVESVFCRVGEEGHSRCSASATGPVTMLFGAGALAGGIALIVTGKTQLFAPSPQHVARSPRQEMPLGGGFALTPRGIEF